MDYLERRLLAIEDRISQWHEQTSQYTSELREFKQQIMAQLEGLDKNKDTLRNELDTVNARVEKVEREMDYIETKNGVQPCVDVDDKLVEQQVFVAKKENKVKYTKSTDCSDMIEGIKAMKILKRMGSTKGMWIKDSSSGKVYLFSGTEESTFYEFTSVRDLTQSQGTLFATEIHLPSAWKGTGLVVYNNHLYYINASEGFRLMKFELQKNTLVASAVLPGKHKLPVYNLNPETLIDLARDEEGLWAIYATKENEKYIQLAKVNYKTLVIEQTWVTPCIRENTEAAFVVCGTLYVVYNSKLPSRSYIQCVFDVSNLVTDNDVPTVYFPKRYGSHSSLKYSPMEQLLYAWDDGYQILYRLQIKKKAEV